MTVKFPEFVLDEKAGKICARLLATRKFANQKQLELEALQLLAYAQAVTATGKGVASIDIQAKSIREVRLAYMQRMENAGLIGKTPDASDQVLKRFLSDPQGYVDKLVSDGVFTSVDDFTEQSLILTAFIFTELAGGRSLASINNANNTYGEWSFPLQKRMKQ